MSESEKTELEAGYAHDQRRYADEEVIDLYDTKSLTINNQNNDISSISRDPRRNQGPN